MVIQHNLSALNAARQYNIVDRAKTKHTEKLSSGYRINRAADDAAGLSISEKLRRQARGLSKGVENAQDGISLCQVADGALNEVHDMMQRLEELSVQAANGTNTYADRKAIQQEITQLLAEIDRISDTTTFNEHCLFGGSSAGETPPAPSSSQAPTNPAPIAAAAYAMPDMGAAYAVAALDVAAPVADTEVKCGDFMVSGVGYYFDSTNGVLKIEGGANVTISGTGKTTTNRIEVAADANANITLKNVKIDVSNDDYTAAFKITDNSTGNVTVTLDGSNTLGSGKYCAGLQKNGAGAAGAGIGKLTITGTGSLYAIGGREGGAGIGGGNGKAGSNIKISGGYVDAISGYWTPDGSSGGSGAAGIGGGKNGTGSDIEITGGTVAATGSGGGAGIGGGSYKTGSNITISGGEVTARIAKPNFMNPQSIGNGHGVTADSTGITVGGSAYQPAKGTWTHILAGQNGALIIDDNTGKVTGNLTLDKNYTIPSHWTVTVDANATLTVGNGATLTNKGTIHNSGAIDVYGKFIDNGILNGNPVTDKTGGGAPTQPDPPAQPAEVPCGDFTVIGGVKGTDYDFDDGTGVLTIKDGADVTIKGTGNATANRIEVADGASAKVTLKDVNIDVSGQSGAAAFKIADNSTGNVTVALDGANTLKSGQNCAGLQKNSEGAGTGTLTITGSGSLTATGGQSGAGIGGGNNSAGSNIEINGGSVTAAGGTGAQGIGGGQNAGGTGNTVGGSAYTPAGATSTIVAGQDGALIIDDKTGTVTGNVTLDKDFTIPSGVTVTVDANATLTVGNGATLTNDGTINNDGAIDVYGSFINNGTLNGNPVTDKTGGEGFGRAAKKWWWIHSGVEPGIGLMVEIDNMNTSLLGLSGMDVTTDRGAANGINAVKGALSYVSDLRSKIGAQQNRLEHTINNENNIVENTQAAESRIRDADVAQEMVGFSVENILAQAGVSVLSQANRDRQGALALLQ